jgi:hypothetical protein
MRIDERNLRRNSLRRRRSKGGCSLYDELVILLLLTPCRHQRRGDIQQRTATIPIVVASARDLLKTDW